MVLFLVRAQEKASNQLKAQTVTDSLTGLFNRAVLNKKHIGDIQALNEHKDSCYICDIKHQAALILKKELESDESWPSFIELAAKGFCRKNLLSA